MLRINKGTTSNCSFSLIPNVGLQSFSFYIFSVSRCVKSMANACVLTVAAGRVWRHPSPPPVRPPHQGPPAATPQAHRWAYLPAHLDATARSTLRWGQSRTYRLLGNQLSLSTFTNFEVVSTWTFFIGLLKLWHYVKRYYKIIFYYLGRSIVIL